VDPRVTITQPVNKRAQSIGIARFFLGLLVAAVLWWIMQDITEPITDYAANTTSNATANQGTTWIVQGIQWWPVFAMLVSVMGLIVYSIYVREVQR